MQTIREITEDDVSEAEYTTFDSTADDLDSVQRLKQEVRAEVIAKQFQSDTSSWFSSCSCSKCTLVFGIGMVIALIWMAMAVPLVLYTVEVVRFIACYI